MAVKITKKETVQRRTQVDLSSEDIETIVREYVEKTVLKRKIDAIVDFSWDASTEGLVRGLRMTVDEFEEKE